MANICFRAIVTGRVQGVFFRAHTKKQAQKLNLVGYAKNLADGSVEVIACGDEKNIEILKEWLQHGPDTASVTAVQFETIQQQKFTDFEVL